MCPASGRTTSWRAGDAVAQRLGRRRRRQGIVRADDDQRGTGDGGEAGPGVGPRLQRLEAVDDAFGACWRGRSPASCSGTAPAACAAGPTSFGQHRLQHRVRAALASRRLQAHAVGPGLVGVGLGAGVGEDQRAAALRRQPMHGERDVAAHRQAADDRVLAAEVPQQRQHVVGVVVDRQGRRPARLAEVAQVGRDERPAVRRGGVQRLPHAGVEREPVQQDQRPSPAGLQPRDRLPTHLDRVARRHRRYDHTMRSTP